MKRSAAVLLLVAVLAVLCAGCRKDGPDKEAPEVFCLEATVIEVSGNALLVAPVEGSREQTDQIWVGAPQRGGEEYLKTAVPGGKVWILYDGMLAESYPEQIVSPYSIQTEKTASLFPDVYSELITRDDIVIQGNGGLRLNLPLWEDFWNAVNQGEEAEVTVVQFTEEGDPVYMFLSFRENRYHLRSDFTYDRFGQSLGIQDRDYSVLQRLEVEKTIYFILTNRAFENDKAFAGFLAGSGGTPDTELQMILTIPK